MAHMKVSGSGPCLGGVLSKSGLGAQTDASRELPAKHAAFQGFARFSSSVASNDPPKMPKP